MTLEQLEAEVLALSKDAQAILLARLLEHLGQSGEIDPDIAVSWIEEAEKRNESTNMVQTAGIPAEEIFQRIRASLQ